jgi:hypothetical protein
MSTGSPKGWKEPESRETKLSKSLMLGDENGSVMARSITIVLAAANIIKQTMIRTFHSNLSHLLCFRP